MFFKNTNSTFFQEQSILKASDIAKWKKQKNQYNFKFLPHTVILNANIRNFSIKTQLLSKKIKGITGNNYILNNNLMIASDFGNGASALITLLEELKCLGVENFIFIGFSGIINENLKEGEIYRIKNAFSCNGTSTFYSYEEENFTAIKNEWYNYISKRISSKETLCLSTDAPYRETKSLINNYTDKGACLVDMECASLYAFAKYYNLNSICFLIASDNLVNGIWTPPENMSLLNKKKSIIVKSLAKYL